MILGTGRNYTFNFGNNFGPQVSKIDTILEKDHQTLAELLEEDTIINELKNSNELLIKYLTEDRLKEIMDYILFEPGPKSTKSEGYKFPFVASQLLSTNIKHIIEFFVKPAEEGTTLEKRCANLRTLLDFAANKEINYTLAGYFEKVLSMIVTAQPFTVLNYIYLNQYHIENIANHIYSGSMMESVSLLLNTNKIMFMPSTGRGGYNYHANFNSTFYREEGRNKTRIYIFQILFEKALEEFTQVDEFETHIGAVSLICELFESNQKILDSEVLIEGLFTQPNIESLFNRISPLNHSSIGHLIAIFKSSVNFFKQDHQGKFDLVRQHIWREYSKHLGDFVEHLITVAESKKDCSSTVNNLGREAYSFGKHNLDLLQIISIIITSGVWDAELDTLVPTTRLIDSFPQLMIAFPWNDMMMNLIVVISNRLLREEMPLSRAYYLEHAPFYSALRTVEQKKNIQKKKGCDDKVYSLASLAHFQSISLEIEKILASGGFNLDESNHINKKTDEDWQHWMNNFRIEQKKLHEIDLGGVAIKTSQELAEHHFDFSDDDVSSRYSDFLNPDLDESLECPFEPQDLSDAEENKRSKVLEAHLPSSTPIDRLRVDELSGTKYDPAFDGIHYFHVEDNKKEAELLAELRLS